MATITDLDLWDLAAISGLVIITAGLLLGIGLRLSGQLLLASARVILQVLMLGIFTTLVFQAPQPGGVLFGIGLLLLAVSIAISNRWGQVQLLPIIGGSLLLSTMVVTGYGQLLVIQPPVWYHPQYLLALVGILLASSPAVVVGVGQEFLQIVQQERGAIETHLSLGATASQAIRPYRQAALQRGLLPIIQNLAVTGLITIPTLMAGLILAGVPPLLAAVYQIVVLLMVLVHQILVAILVVQGLVMSLFRQHQLLEKPEIFSKTK
jgi:putative ABC transport system permease protein